MLNPSAKILFDCERMKYANTGLYHFCKQLGMALTDEELGIRNQLTFYTREREEGIFGTDLSYLQQHSLHKFLLPDLRKFNIWHATYQGTMYYPYHRNIQVVLTVHDLNFLHEEDRPQIKKDRELKKLQRKINRANKIVAISSFVKEDIEKNIDLKGKKVEVIYNGCNINNAITPEQPQNNLPSDFLFTIGTIVPKKNFHVLPNLLVGNEMQLIIAGVIQSEEYKTMILDEAKRLNVASRVIFIGTISEAEKYWYLQHCKAFVFPSLMEGFGLPVIEAMAFGKPVFLSTKTSLPEIGGDQAYYFSNFEGIHMQEVFAKGMLGYEAGEINPKTIQARADMFSWKNAAKAYATIYEQMIS